jgi:osmoprotectant transport system permease protein
MNPSKLKVILGYGLMGMALFVLPFGEFKPNRVIKGILLYPKDLFGLWISLILVSLVILLLISELKFKISKTWVRFLIMSFLTVLPALMMMALSAAKVSGIDYNPLAARISLGLGFYVFVVGVLIILSQYKSFRWILLGMVLLILMSALLNKIPNLGLIKELNNLQDKILQAIQTHLILSLSSAFVAVIPGILLGYLSYSRPRWREWVMGLVNVFQVAPTLSLLGLVMIPLSLLSKSFPLLADLGIKGIGFAPAFIVLTLYCLLPIVANTYAGFQQIDESILRSAQGMGLTKAQILTKVSFPLASPIILSGIQTALTQNIGNTILAGLVGGGGLGALIFLGLSQAAPDLVLLGTIPVVIMALISDAFFEVLKHQLGVKMGVHYDTTQTS